MGNRLTVTAADGSVTSWEYDLAGQATASVDPAGARATYTYDPAGRVATVTDALGAVQTSAYDAAGRLRSSTDALDRTTSYTYDDAGRLSATTLPSGATTSYAYDAAGQQTSSTDPLGAVSTTSYDEAGRPITETDADGRRVATAYDPAGRATSETRGDGSVLTWTYDAAGQQTGYTDAAGATTDFSYDGAGRTATRTDSAGRVTAFAYDPAGNLTSTTAADGNVTTRAYDAMSRVTAVDYVSGTPDVEFSYDAAGRRSMMMDGTGTSTYTYDLAGRVTHITTPNGTVGYSWDALGRLTTLTYPGGDAVERSYDQAGQLRTITDWAGGTYEFSWTGDGREASITYPNGVRSSIGHDATGQVTSIEASDRVGNALLELTYEYSGAGLEIGTTTTRTSAHTTTAGYTWDPMARLASIVGTQPGTVSFTSGDQLAELPDGTVLTYDGAGQPRTASGAGKLVSFSYDDRGNRVSESGLRERELSYDAADRLIGTEDAAGTSVHAYSGDGLRSSLIESDPDGASVARAFSWDVTFSVPRLLGDGLERWIYGTDARPIAQVGADGSILYLLNDALGSTRAVTDEGGSVIAESDYSPYGRELTAGLGHQPVSDITRFGFAGEYRDNSGLIYLRARHLDPNTGQFLTVDPLADVSRSIYGYATGNPLQRTDPLGLVDIDWDLAIGVGLVAAIAAGAVLCVASVACAAALGAAGGGLALAGGGTVAGASTLTVAGGAVLAGVGATGASVLGQGLANSNLVMQNESPFDSAGMSDDCAEKIANGHAFDEHAAELGVRTPEELEALIRDTVRFGERQTLPRGRTAWWSDGVGVIRDPSRWDSGTVFKMTRQYFLDLD